MRNSRVDLRLPEKQKSRWMKASKHKGLDLSELIRRSVEDAIRDSPYSDGHGRKAKDKGEAAGAR